MANNASAQRVPYEGVRIENGGLKLGDDWPGLFIRGDSCIDLVGRVQSALELLQAHTPEAVKGGVDYILATNGLEGLRDIIARDVLLSPRD